MGHPPRAAIFATAIGRGFSAATGAALSFPAALFAAQ
jgi:hypothetical protein